MSKLFIKIIIPKILNIKDDTKKMKVPLINISGHDMFFNINPIGKP